MVRGFFIDSEDALGYIYVKSERFMMKLVLKSSITKKNWEYEVEDSNDSRLFYHFETFALTENMDEGEYEYELYDVEDNTRTLLAQGLLQIGDYKPNNKTYTQNSNGIYKQYNG